VPSSSQTELLSSVFVGVNGSPMLFFVQVDIRSRMQIIQCVKVRLHEQHYSASY
jgi:hypothetical protein